jgi:hypothetical protein
VWHDRASYDSGTYYYVMGVNFAIVALKGVWVIAFFTFGSPKWGGITAGTLAAVWLSITIATVVDEPDVWYNWVLNILITLFYMYATTVCVMFLLTKERNDHLRIDGRSTSSFRKWKESFVTQPGAPHVHAKPSDVRHHGFSYSTANDVTHVPDSIGAPRARERTAAREPMQE